MSDRANNQNPPSNILRRPIGLHFSLLLLGIGLMLCIAFNPSTTVATESLAIPNGDRSQLVARLFVPKTTSVPHPAMVLCHGVNASKEMMTPLAVELARRGIAAIAFDFSGFGESERHSPDKAKSETIDVIDNSNRADALAVLAFVRSHPERFDRLRIGIGGHSMGARTALDVAQLDRQLRATIMLGMSGEASPTVPKNLFLGVGLYEQLNPPQEVLAMLQQATDGKSDVFQFTGDFAASTARRMVISATADHIIEPYDPFLLQQAASWAQQALQVPAEVADIRAGLSVTFPWYILGLLLLFCGTVLTGAFMFLRTGKPVVLPQARQFYRYGVAFIIVALMGVLWGLGAGGHGPSRTASNLLILCYVMALATNYALRYPEKFTPALRVAGLYGVLFLEPFILPALLSGSSEILKNPAYFTGLPQFLLQWPVFFIYNYTTVVKLAFFPVYTLDLQPSWLFLMLAFIEFVWPGITLTGLEKGAVRVVRWLRQPLTLSGTGPIQARALGLVGLLILVLAIVLYQQAQSGVLFLAANSGFLTVLLIGQMVLLPVLIIVSIVRSRPFRHLERWCLGQCRPSS